MKMTKNINRNEDIDNYNDQVGKFGTELGTIEVVKPKWTLKKKLIVGGGVLAALAAGAIALVINGKRNSEVELATSYCDDYDVDYTEVPIAGASEDPDQA
jgi:hypothetical protein